MKIVKLDENKNPYLPDGKMLRYFKKNAKLISEYPSIDNSIICEEISKTFNINVKNVYFGNGSMDIFDKLVKVFSDKRYGFLTPTFWGFRHFLYLNHYENVLEAQYSEIESENLNNLKTLAKKCDVVYLCNRNNPNLHYFESELLLKVVEENPKCQFVIDETLLTYEDYFKKSVFSVCPSYNNLTVVISLSKILGIAGIRSGVLFSNSELVERLKEIEVPFVTSKLSQDFIKNNLNRFVKLDNIKDKIYKNYKYLENKLAKDPIKKFENKNSCFVNVFLNDDVDIEGLKNYLTKKHIILRYSIEFYGVTEKFLRISAGTKYQYSKLVKYFNKFFLEVV